MKEICPIYADMGRPGNVNLDVHRGEHEIDLPSMLEFLSKTLTN